MYLATMARLSVVAFFALAFALVLPPGADAQTQFGAKIALHAQPATSKSPCTVGASIAAGTDCVDFTTSYLPLNTGIDVYLVVAGDPGPGISGAQFGIDYDPAPQSGVGVFGWTACGPLTFPGDGPNGPWPAAGSANVIRWGDCQQTIPPGGSYAQALVGFFYVYAYGDDVIEVTPDRTAVCYGELKVWDCAQNETSIPSPYAELNSLGDVGFGSRYGANPCFGVADASLCGVSPNVLDFGTLVVGESADLILRIYDQVGLGPGIGEFSVDPLPGGDFSIASGAGYYGDPVSSVDVTFRFTPTAPGPQATAFEVDPCTYCPQVTLTGNAVPALVPVTVDVRPGACPNPVSLQGKGPLHVAVLGSEDLDVTAIDMATLRLEGVPAGKERLRDVGGPPSSGLACDCSHGGPDGFQDLNLMFSVQEVFEALDPPSFKEEWTLHLTGNLLDGTPIAGEDCVVVVGVPKGPGAGSSETGGGQISPLSLDVREQGNGHRIEFRLAAPGEVTLSVFDVRGRLVERLVQSSVAGGEHTVLWNGGSHPRGVYFYQLRSGSRSITKKVTLLRR